MSNPGGNKVVIVKTPLGHYINDYMAQNNSIK